MNAFLLALSSLLDSWFDPDGQGTGGVNGYPW